MKSFQFEEYGGPLSYHESAAVPPVGDDVLLRVHACRVCHSDVHLWEGHFDMGGGRKADLKGGREPPFTLGHEILGEVRAVGAAVRFGGRVIPTCQRRDSAPPRQPSPRTWRRWPGSRSAP
jgi:D-arabinose 1-dehydrogenase-like Zn-dependent alcohol dehydrogenase